MLNLFHVDEMPNTILLKRNDIEFEVVVSKRTIVVPYAEWKVLEGNIGYIRLFGFSGHVVKETEDAVRLLKERDVSGIILDLRDNPGGSLNDVLDIADMFLPKDKLIVTIKSRIAEEVQYKAEIDPIYDGQLILLVNENSASASELLSGALKDHGVATIIGTQTFGKGIVQTYFPIAASKGWVKLTTDAYYTPNDVCIHGIGITPDIIVESESEYDNLPIDSIPFESDVQLQEAIHYMRGN